MSKTPVGVIGTGIMGERHCRVYAGMADVELVGVHDLERDRALPIARRYGTRFFSLLDDLLAQVEAVSIATPTPSHAAIAVAALERGVHVLIEKPIAATPAEAETIMVAAEQSGCLVQVGHIERFNPAYIELTHILADMRPLAITMRRLSPYQSSATDVDVVCDLMIHDLDLALHLGGAWPDEIYAVGRTLHDQGLDHVVAMLSFRDGPMVTLLASRITEQKIRDISVVATNAYIEADLLSKSIAIHHRTIPQYLQGPTSVKYRQESLIERIVVPANEPLLMELKHFVAAVAQRSAPLVGTQQGLAALRLAHTIKQLAENTPSPTMLPIDAPVGIRRSRVQEVV
ncbi:Gfo/Idh/MocA family oxidoreductase [Kallotenue papyrolyticum]|uniref:Gfo/Idh/MocA family oxidoreductase n=1 Tax=Kallotenue papyrolyticum TaxID=1325125 RepID=UPI00047852DE|nr:Gfo/Idh/MocA family oxidoreductase [Kallotenue papyrolyticum]